MKRFLIGLLIISIIVISIAFYFFFFNYPKPSIAEQARTKKMLIDYANEQWHSRVELKELKVRLELQGSDFPINHKWKEYKYFAFFRIKGTKAVFFASLPTSVTKKELSDWWGLSSELNKEEVALLVAYSEVSNIPAGSWGSDNEYGLYEDQYPNKQIWTVEPISIGAMHSNSYDEYVFERLKNRKFKLLEHYKGSDE